MGCNCKGDGNGSSSDHDQSVDSSPMRRRWNEAMSGWLIGALIAIAIAGVWISNPDRRNMLWEKISRMIWKAPK